MVGWHSQLNGYESEQTPGDSEKQGSLTCCSPWDRKELDLTQQLNNNTSRFLESSLTTSDAAQGLCRSVLKSIKIT